VGEGGEGCI